MRSDEYVRVRGELVHKSNDAVLVHPNEKGNGSSVWIPYSLMHGSDELTFQKAKVGQLIDFRLREWKATGTGFKEI